MKVEGMFDSGLLWNDGTVNLLDQRIIVIHGGVDELRFPCRCDFRVGTVFSKP